jgi:hypothetical protein
MISLNFHNDQGWIPIENQVRLVKHPYPTAKDTPYQIDKPTTNLGSNVIMISCPAVKRDPFSDDEIGDTIRYIKENFGDAPLIEAYEAALDTFKEPDRRWKEYLDEEESKFKSIFE